MGAGTDAEQLPEASANAGHTQEPAEPCQFSPPEAVVYLNELDPSSPCNISMKKMHWITQHDLYETQLFSFGGAADVTRGVTAGCQESRICEEKWLGERQDRNEFRVLQRKSRLS